MTRELYNAATQLVFLLTCLLVLHWMNAKEHVMASIASNMHAMSIGWRAMRLMRSSVNCVLIVFVRSMLIPLSSNILKIDNEWVYSGNI